jgi:hypothetical protein
VDGLRFVYHLGCKLGGANVTFKESWGVAMHPDIEDGSEEGQAVAQRKRWSTPRVILSEAAGKEGAAFPHPIAEGPPTSDFHS